MNKILAFGKYLAEKGWKPYGENVWENSDDDTASTETIYSDFSSTYQQSLPSKPVGDVEEMDKWLDWFEGYISNQIMNYNNPNATLAIIATLRTKLNINAKIPDPLAPPTCKNCNAELGDCDCGQWEPEYPSDKSGYAAAPQKGMKWVKASERLPEIWKCHGSASEKVPIKLYGEFFHVGRIVKNGGRIKFEILDGKNPTDFESESFHLIEWLDESPSPSEAGDGWVSEKPNEFTEDCILLTMSFHKVGPIFNAFEIRKTEGYDENENPIWYWGIFQDGDEWGDYADLYKIVPFPAPPIQK